MRLYLGCGPRPFHEQHLPYTGPAWTLVDKYVKGDHIKNWDATDLPVQPESVDEIYTSHMLEHIEHTKLHKVLKHWYSLLRTGGTVTINVPDIYWAFNRIRAVENDLVDHKEYYNQIYGDHGVMSVIYGSQSHEGEYHKSAFTKDSLRDLLYEVGFRSVAISETFDSHDMGVLIANALK